jgi:hypothetical protein
MYAQAPGEVQEALYSGQITPAVVEAVLGNQYASDEDKLTVLLKVISGVITSTGTPRMREIMALIPEMQPYADLRLRWRSPDVAMTAEQLQEELIDIRNSRAASKRERAQQAAEDRMMVEAGFNALGWLDQVAEQMDLVEQMWPVLNANPWVQQRLAIKMDRIADRMRALTQPEEQPDSDPEPLVIIQAE